jgi:predicted MPP superfamily phosphohydrolase
MTCSFSRRALLKGAVSFALVPPVAEAAKPARPFEVTCTTLFTKGLHEAHDGLTIAQLSDLHVGWQTPEARLRAAIDTTNALRPDLVLLTGDFVTWSQKPLLELPKLLGQLRAPTFACLGNHDHIVDARAVRSALEKLNFTVLQNAHTVTRVRNAPLSIVGIDDGATHHDDVDASLKGIAPTGSKLVMAHTPPTALQLPKGRHWICFSGHTHGGSVMVPGITPAIYGVFRQPYVRGLHQVDGNQLYVNRGIGFGTNLLAPRINSEPELSVFTLRLVS